MSWVLGIFLAIVGIYCAAEMFEALFDHELIKMFFCMAMALIVGYTAAMLIAGKFD
jgi:membrane protein CcdC involved in cytochrome C biogenesis